MSGLRRIRVRLTALYAALLAVPLLVLLAVAIVVIQQSRVHTGEFLAKPDMPPVHIDTVAEVQHQNTLHVLGFVAVGLVAVGLIAAVPIAWWLAGRALAPVRRAFASQQRFIANASHELRTPLTLERTLLQVALSDPAASAESLRRTCEELLSAGREQERLLDALLTLAASENGLDHREPTDLAQLTDTVLAQPRDKISDGSLSLRQQVQTAPTTGDPALLERLIANLVDNAAHHNLDGGWVTVSTGVSDGCAQVEVANSGVPIDPTQIDGLFQPFQRLGQQRVGEGHGLGLSIVRAIAEAHHASVLATPTVGGGLTVRVRFPLRERSELTRG